MSSPSKPDFSSIPTGPHSPSHAATAAAEASSPQPQPKQKNRPPSVRMPSPPIYRTSSPTLRGGPKVTTPTAANESRDQPSMSPSGPLSPSSALGSNSFVYPIRSVYQGRGQPDPNQPGASTPDGEQSASLSRAGSSSQRQADQNRRQSASGNQDLVGMSTIAQMLEQSSFPSSSQERDPNEQQRPGVATFTSRQSRSGANQSPSHGETINPPQGFFSLPLTSNETTDTPFFSEARRTSDPESLSHQRSPEPVRPELPHQDNSASTVHAEPRNDSAEAEGSGLTDKHRPPVGQPQEEATEVNYVDRPGQLTGDQERFHQLPKKSPPQSHTAHPPPRDEQPDTLQPEIQQPIARKIGGTSQTSGGSRHRTSQVNLELDEEGNRALVGEFSDIIRLAEAGSLPSTVGTGASGTGTTSAQKGKGSVGGSTGLSNGPTGARLAHQQRGHRSSTTRDTVRDFIEQQAHTVNLSDPNAPTPSPTPHASDDTTDETQSDDSEGRGLGINLPQVDESNEVEDSDASVSVRDSSEMATASTDDQPASEADSEEVPIVTFRFEHVATDDGHHVVVGREGKLQRCEDEPITTPGAVQGFGVLLVLEEDYDADTLQVRQVSENSTELLGLSPRYLFRLDCFTRILTDEQEDILRDNIEFLPDSAIGKGSVAEEGPQVFLLSGYGEPGSDDDVEDDSTLEAGGRRREWTCWVAAHRPKQETWDKVDEQGNKIPPPNLIILEFELERDVYNPLIPTFEFSSGGDTPESGSITTVSGGRQSTSTGSEAPTSEDSQTTIASTPRPHMAHQTSEGSGTVMRSTGSGSTQQPSQSTLMSSKYSGNQRPMGLEGVDVDVPLERIIESTTNHAKPLRALERMRRSGNHGDLGSAGSGSGETASSGRRSRRQARRPPGSGTGTMDVFAVLGQINDQLGSAPDLQSFLKITVGVVQDLCRFHRVLIYQFDEAFNGQVVAELVEWGKTTDLFKGLMFPAADIPAQARQLYMTNKVRLLYDRSQTTARIVLRSKEDLDHPLDMTHCYLRAMSPIHIKYLANMHVRSSMSVSIMAFDQLWGLIACHSYGHHGMRVSFPVRQMMRILSDSISRNIERLSYAQRLHTRKLISTIPTQHHPTGYIVSNADDLLEIFDADSGLLVIGDGCKLLGNNEQGTTMLAIAEFLRIMRFDSIKASNHLARDFPDLILPRAQDTIAGLLYVPLTAKAGQDFIVFLRKGQVREVQWAGKPYKDETSGVQASLEPRKSFKMWSETVIGRSRAWSDDQLESAGVLALIYGKFIQVWREKQTAMASNQLTAILLSNTSHAVRTPLSQIINTLELALSGDIDADTRSMLENSHQASRALLFHVHDLLDLTRIETGNETAFNDPFDIRQSLTDAVRLFQTESTRRGIDFRVNLSPSLPPSLIGDSRKIKTVISNLVANSIKFTEQGYIEVYCGVKEAEGNEVALSGAHIPIEIIISDTGCGIPTAKLEAMFVTLEGAEEAKSHNPGIGLGLAVVARIVDQLGGQLRAESTVGQGSKFFFTLSMLAYDGRVSSRESSVALSAPRTRNSTRGSGSVESLRSGSNSSHGASEIDTFVQDFASSHMLAPVSADDQRLKDAEHRMSRPGTFPVTDSSYPVKPSKMDTDDNSASPTSTSPRLPTSPQPQRPLSFQRGISHSESSPRSPAQPRMLSYPTPSTPATPASTASGSEAETLRVKRGPNGEQKLRVLVVEDDAINSQILQKRLRMDKHTAIAVTNGQEAVDRLKNDWDIDVVLMDIQMPIMDGRTAAREIRKLESTMKMPRDIDPLRIDGRIPIFAVSASLYESDRGNLGQNFDGWLLKPLDFNRVRALMAGLEDPAKRSAEVYVQGHWERGGYLRDRNDSPRPSTSRSK